MKHRVSLATSKRLQRVLRAIERAGSGGITTYELILEARVTDVKDAVYELRQEGVDVVTELVDVGDARVARYTLRRCLPVRREREAVEVALGVR
jgi:hypothetical protein